MALYSKAVLSTPLGAAAGAPRKGAQEAGQQVQPRSLQVTGGRASADAQGRSPHKQGSSSTSVLRKNANIWAPSITIKDDAQRVESAGRPISPAGEHKIYARAAQRLGVQGLQASASAPSFPEIDARPGPASRPGSSPGLAFLDEAMGGRRRGIGGRHHSKVSLGLPPSPHRGSSSSSTKSPLSRTGGGFLDPNAPVLTSTEVSPLWSELHPDASDKVHPDNLFDPAKRAVKVLGTLSALRRQGGRSKRQSSSSTRPASAASPEGGEVGGPDAAAGDAQDAPEETIMFSTLRDLCDTCGELQELQASMELVQDPVGELGVSRHPTALISGRTIAVVRRKVALLKAAEARASQLQAALGAAEAMRQLLLRTDQPHEAVMAEAPEELRVAFEALRNVKGFISDHTHKDGDPADANKSQFEAFAASFGLPAKHEILLRLRSLANETVDWWATATLECAMRKDPEEDIDAMKRMINLAAGVMNEKKHDNLFKAEMVIADRACKRCVDRAVELFEAEEQRAESCNVPMPDMAKRCAKAILAEIEEAVDVYGADVNNQSMREAKRLAKEAERLEQDMYVELKRLAQLKVKEEQDRNAQKALKHAQTCQEKDAAAVDAAKQADGPEAVPEVGLASALADSIEAEVERTKELGVPGHHAAFAECASIAKELRDKDGTRKRARARLERLAKQATARAAQAEAGPDGAG